MKVVVSTFVCMLRKFSTLDIAEIVSFVRSFVGKLCVDHNKLNGVCPVNTKNHRYRTVLGHNIGASTVSSHYLDWLVLSVSDAQRLTP